MNLVICPHCKSHRIVTAKVPKDVVVVMPCPSCGELVVLFRKKIIALNRKVLEKGSLEERKKHLAEVIAEFLEPGIFSALTEGSTRIDGFGKAAAGDDDDDLEPGDLPPISDQELERFQKIQLSRIDDSRYFRRHFQQ